ncbi:hypothetical protein GCK72_001067 [Caenorhabditis remanei]|uniref:Uncharacterized protein n=1 Tax=Caenorhabditis remanei TaxID=31234 RepID=A0A6A5HPU6_CAERE|nr:hypothetical protein GCK72_001067 [Caenorhabditis remanei]KAF1769251.1 hypothetical protein GCK72_001067 [Caenorhabditis remanei]
MSDIREIKKRNEDPTDREQRQMLRSAQYDEAKKFFKCLRKTGAMSYCDYVGSLSETQVHIAEHTKDFLFSCILCGKELYDATQIYTHRNGKTVCGPRKEDLIVNIPPKEDTVDLWRARNVFIDTATREEYDEFKRGLARKAEMQPGNNGVPGTPGYGDEEDNNSRSNVHSRQSSRSHSRSVSRDRSRRSPPKIINRDHLISSASQPTPSVPPAAPNVPQSSGIPGFQHQPPHQQPMSQADPRGFYEQQRQSTSAGAHGQAGYQQPPPPGVSHQYHQPPLGFAQPPPGFAQQPPGFYNQPPPQQYHPSVQGPPGFYQEQLPRNGYPMEHPPMFANGGADFDPNILPPPPQQHHRPHTPSKSQNWNNNFQNDNRGAQSSYQRHRNSGSSTGPQDNHQNSGWNSSSSQRNGSYSNPRDRGQRHENYGRNGPDSRNNANRQQPQETLYRRSPVPSPQRQSSAPTDNHPYGQPPSQNPVAPPTSEWQRYPPPPLPPPESPAPQSTPQQSQPSSWMPKPIDKNLLQQCATILQKPAAPTLVPGPGPAPVPEVNDARPTRRETKVPSLIIPDSGVSGQQIYSGGVTTRSMSRAQSRNPSRATSRAASRATSRNASPVRGTAGPTSSNVPTGDSTSSRRGRSSNRKEQDQGRGTISLAIQTPQEMRRQSRSAVRYRTRSRSKSMETPSRAEIDLVQQRRNEFQQAGTATVKVPPGRNRVCMLIDTPPPPKTMTERERRRMENLEKLRAQEEAEANQRNTSNMEPPVETTHSATLRGLHNLPERNQPSTSSAANRGGGSPRPVPPPGGQRGADRRLRNSNSPPPFLGNKRRGNNDDDDEDFTDRRLYAKNQKPRRNDDEDQHNRKDKRHRAYRDYRN